VFYRPNRSVKKQYRRLFRHVGNVPLEESGPAFAECLTIHPSAASAFYGQVTLRGCAGFLNRPSPNHTRSGEAAEILNHNPQVLARLQNIIRFDEARFQSAQAIL
jgi:hypothetical protein